VQIALPRTSAPVARYYSPRDVAFRMASTSRVISPIISSRPSALSERRRDSRARSTSDSATPRSVAHEAFLGTWRRDCTKNQHVVAYLVAHRVGSVALERSIERYEQEWRTAASGRDGEFEVHTTSASGTDRTLTYSLSDDGFVESFQTSAIFGNTPGSVRRFATFDASTRTHQVRTESSLGSETTTRNISDDGSKMTCVRRFIDSKNDIDVTSVEQFVRES